MATSISNTKIAEYKQIVASEGVEGARRVYSELEAMGYSYAGWAKGVATGQSVTGQSALDFLKGTALLGAQGQESINLSEAEIDAIRTDMAMGYLDTLSNIANDNGGHVSRDVRYDEMEAFHKEAFENNGLSLDNWTLKAPMDLIKKEFGEEAVERQWERLRETAGSGVDSLMESMWLANRIGQIASRSTDESSRQAAQNWIDNVPGFANPESLGRMADALFNSLAESAGRAGIEGDPTTGLPWPGVFSDVNSNYQNAVSIAARDPLAIDLDSDGIETVTINPTSPILFDHNGDGVKTATGWLKGDDAWLVHDIDTNGIIDSGKELLGVDTDITVDGVTRKAASGFEALAALDGNGDRIFNASDAAFNTLQLWQDLNQNGIAEAGELSTLASKGIISINLNYTSTNENLGGGNSITGKATVTRATGTTELDSVVVTNDSAANLNLADNPFYSELPAVPVTSTAEELPEMRGSGMVNSLRQAMSLGTEAATALSTTVAAFAQGQTRDAQMAVLDTLLQQWGATSSFVTSSPFLGGDGISQTGYSASAPQAAAIKTFAEQNPTLFAKIITLERFNGTNALPQLLIRWGSNLPAQVTSALEASYKALQNSAYFGLAAQTRLKPYFDAISVEITSTSVEFSSSGVTTLLNSLKQSDERAAVLDLVDLAHFSNTAFKTAGLDARALLADWLSALPAESTIHDLNWTELLGAATNGNDFLIGGRSGESINAGQGDDWVYGGLGNDNIQSGNGNDTLIGGIGNDTLNGGYGSNTYVFGQGDGSDVIIEVTNNTSTNPSSTLKFRSGVSPSDVSVRIISDTRRQQLGFYPYALEVSIIGTTDKIVVSGFFSDTTTNLAAADDTPIHRFEFSDGASPELNTVWDLAQIMNKVYQGTSGNDSIWGASTNDSIQGQDGTDQIRANAGNDTVSGGTGNDTIYGGSGNDSMLGGDGIDQLYGEAGDDTIEGGADNDYISDGEGHNLLIGDAGNDNIIGGAGNDTLIGGIGNDTLNGGYGSNTYVFGQGDGSDVIIEVTNNTATNPSSTLKFRSGVSPSDVSVRIISDTRRQQLGFYPYALEVSIIGTTDKIVVSGFFSDTTTNLAAADDTPIHRFEFSDGASPELNTVWDLAQIMNKVYQGTSGNDSIWGASTNDSIQGQDGTDQIRANAGNDTVSGGTGNDTIYGGSGNDSMLGGDGIDQLYGEAGDDTIEGGADNDYISDGEGHNLLIGDAGNDNIIGGAGNDTLIGGIGNDTLNGGYGSNTYVFGQGDGSDVIIEVTNNTSTNPSSTLKFRSGVSPSDVSVRIISDTRRQQLGFYPYALEVSIIGTTDKIVVSGFFSDTTTNLAAADDTPIHRFEFSDGASPELNTVWDLAQIMNKVYQGTSGNDSIWGASTNDSIQGQDGTDQIRANAGNDTVSGGAGNDTIYGGSGNDSMLGGDGIDQLYGEDGDDTLEGGAENDQLVDSQGNNLFIGGRGNDTLSGGVSNDTYLFTRGDGADTISDYSTDTTSDLIAFGANIAPSDLAYTRNANHLIVTIKENGFATGDSITIQNWFIGSPYRIERFFFDDGTFLSMDAIHLIATTTSIQGDAGANTINGTTSNDIIYAGAESDTLSADDGADLLFGGAGSDALNGQTGNDLLYGEAGGDTLDGGEGADTLYGGFGNDTYKVDDAGDLVIEGADAGNDTVDTTLSEYVLPDHVENLIMNGKAEVNTASGNALNNYIEGTWLDAHISGLDGNDTLISYDGNDTLDGGLGYDVLEGGAGNDVYYVDQTLMSDDDYHPDEVLEFDGNAGGIDTVYTAIEDYLLPTNVENLVMAGHNADGNELDNLITGSADTNQINGGAGNDTIYGEAGNDTLYGGEGADQLEGGKGVDALYGGAGADTYVYNKGDGYDIIYGQRSEDTLRMKGFTSDQVTFSRRASDIDIIDASSGTSYSIVTLVRQTFESAHEFTGVSQIVFDDKTLTADDIRKLALIGTAGNDTNLRGYASNDSISGFDGNDSLYGEGGTDTLLGGGDADRLEGGADNDTLYGGAGNDTLDGGTGQDVLYGDAGADTYVYTQNSGYDVIYGQRSEDTLRMQGFNSNQVTFNRQFSDISIGYAPSGTSYNILTLVRQAFDGAHEFTGVSQIVFDDKTLTADDIRKAALQGNLGNDTNLRGYVSNDTINGFDGNDYLYGEGGSDLLDGGTGTDYLDGGAGNDTYLFSRGDGSDTISDVDATVGNSDVLQFQPGIAHDQLWFSQSGNDLLISVIGTSDSVRITGGAGASAAAHLEQFQAGGKTLSDTQVANLIQAMASMTPPAMGQTTLTEAQRTQLDPVLASNWA